MTTLAIIGGGVMGEAILKGALARGVVNTSDVVVCELLESRRDYLTATYGVSTTSEVPIALSAASATLVAVKPQESKALKGALPQGSVLISIMAGVTIPAISASFGTNAIVRVMPNTPAAIGEGISAWTATPAVTPGQRDFVRLLLGAIGREIELPEESKLDAVTALSGSGPAYVFLFIESLIEGGVAAGLSRAQSEELAVQTVAGSALYMRASGKSAADLRAQVTSPAGTTAAGLLEMERHAFRATIIDAVQAAHRRAKEARPAVNENVAQIFSLFIYILIIAIFVRSLMSWFPNAQNNEFARFLDRITSPLIEPVRNLMPRTGMIDFAPMIVIFILFLMLRVVDAASNQ